MIGGAAAPESLVRGLEERHGLRPLTSWGMTEIAPVGTVGRSRRRARRCPTAERHALRMKQGVPGALLELRVRNEQGDVPWDGVTMGELEVRGAYVASAYYRPEEDGGWFTADGWFRTGDIASIDPRGYLEIRDRTKDLIKSGGEWISSVALEGALMGHPGGRRGGGRRGAAPQLARAAARGGGAARGPDGRRRPSSAPFSPDAFPGLVAARRRRVRAGHPAHVHRQVPQVRAPRLASRALRRS